MAAEEEIEIICEKNDSLKYIIKTLTKLSKGRKGVVITEGASNNFQKRFEQTAKKEDYLPL